MRLMLMIVTQSLGWWRGSLATKNQAFSLSPTENQIFSASPTEKKTVFSQPSTVYLLSVHTTIFYRRTSQRRAIGPVISPFSVPPPPLFTPHLIPLYQTPQYCQMPAANWGLCGGCQCWGPMIPICFIQQLNWGVARCLPALSECPVSMISTFLHSFCTFSSDNYQ